MVENFYHKIDEAEKDIAEENTMTHSELKEESGKKNKNYMVESC